MYLTDANHDDSAVLPTEGVEVEEIRDADTVRLFVREWQWRARLHFGDRTMSRRRVPAGGEIIDA